MSDVVSFHGDNVRIKGRGNKTELWVNGEMISNDVVRFELRQEGGCCPVLDVVSRYYVGNLEADLENVKVQEAEE